MSPDLRARRAGPAVVARTVPDPSALAPVPVVVRRRLGRGVDRHAGTLPDGRPIVLYIERPRIRWGRAAGTVTAITVPIVGGLLAVAYGLAWLAAHLAAILAAAAAALAITAALAGLALTLTRAGVCCPGLHCPGCGHR